MVDVIYKQTLKDYMAFYDYFLRYNPTCIKRLEFGRKFFILLFLGIAVACVFTAYYWTMIILYFVAAALIVGSVDIAIYYPRRAREQYKKRTRKFLKENNPEDVEGDVHLLMSEETINHDFRGRKFEIPWAKVERIGETPERTFVFVYTWSAIVLPRHGFRTEDEYEKVVAFAKERFAHYHGPQ